MGPVQLNTHIDEIVVIVGLMPFLRSAPFVTRRFFSISQRKPNNIAASAIRVVVKAGVWERNQPAVRLG